jgi:hypothetical protein
MNTKSKPFMAGKVIAAVSAIVLAGCLIKNEQDKKNAQGNARPNLTHISTSKSALIDRDFAGKPITELRIKVVNRITTIAYVSMLNETQLNKLLNDVELSRLNPEFFATSKSAPPKAISSEYILEEHKGKNSQDINLTKLQQKYWEGYKAKILAYHKKNSFKLSTFIHSSKAPALAPDETDPVLTTVDVSDTFFSSSKSLIDLSPAEAKKMREELEQKKQQNQKKKK